jgi:hypothetical protein
MHVENEAYIVALGAVVGVGVIIPLTDLKRAQLDFRSKDYSADIHSRVDTSSCRGEGVCSDEELWGLCKPNIRLAKAQPSVAVKI